MDDKMQIDRLCFYKESCTWDIDKTIKMELPKRSLKLPIKKENDDATNNIIPIEYLGIGPKNIR